MFKRKFLGLINFSRFYPEAFGLYRDKKIYDQELRNLFDLLMNAYVKRNGHNIHKLSAKNQQGRDTYYYVLINDENEAEFLASCGNSERVFDLEQEGQVIGSCFGLKPNEYLKTYLGVRYDFEL